MKQSSSNNTNIASSIFYVDVGGCALRVKRIEPSVAVAAESNPMLVFLHEGLGCIELWRDFPETVCVSTGCAGLVYDRKGYGGSDAYKGPWPLDYLHKESQTYLPGLLQACDITKAVLIGHSDGGTIGLMTVAMHGERICGVITEAAHIFVEDITLEGIRRAVKAFESTELKDKLARYHGENTETVFRRWADRWLSPEFYDWNIKDYLPRITCPLLVLQGQDDEYGTAAQVEGIAALVSGPVATKLIADCGHVPHFQAKETVLDEVTRFIKARIL
ncbi:MAG: alpha/beta hydrolase [Pseudomonadota bacterium]|uniref:Alpha/beta hydrolase n=1 Tax=Candidatus Desulfatibia profunda TaxID=2841695 RepID=A0A8J6TNC5_9BACT|nr:alpha/beta hydrolase [Candidatus Desulfatibia profunda]MBL7180504.1 alpha/beta hydrolase [Desulfobacterales bacterium]